MNVFHRIAAAVLILAGLTAQAQTLPVATAPAPAAPGVADLSKFSTPDALWAHIEELKKGPRVKPANPQQQRLAISLTVAEICNAAGEFVKRYPDDQRYWDARLLQIETQDSLNKMFSRPDEMGTVQALRALAAENSAPVGVRSQARYELLGIGVRHYTGGDPSANAAMVLEQLKQFVADFPAYPSLDLLQYKIAETVKPRDPLAAEAVLSDLAKSGDGKIPEQAKKEVATIERLKSPLDLKFTAVNGAEVDLAGMRGKVVLIDFWASWASQCQQVTPEVVGAYNKYHDKGFEIVGISLDQSRDALMNYTAQNNMPWPEYFDGQGWRNSISSDFAIMQIPAMWLVNKKGYVVSMDGRENLDGQVERLLGD